MNLVAILQLLILLAVANFAPIAAKRLLHERFSYPLDGGLVFFDGRPLFGSSKTIRGILAAVLVTAVCAPLIGLDWQTGVLIASVSMGGDLFSSFVKRRRKLLASAKATGLDQVPESLFPALACKNLLSLSVMDILVGTVVFFVGEVVLARVFYKLHVRDRPY